MVFYFTGTGNSEYAARKLALDEPVISIAECVQNKKYHFTVSNGERLGFVFPVYFFGVPMLVDKFLKRLEISIPKRAYTYVAATCGGHTGSACESFGKLLGKKGLSLDASFSVAMVDNYVLMYKLPGDKKRAQILEQADGSLEEIKRRIQRKESGDFNRLKGFLAPVVSRTAYSIYVHGRKTDKFTVEESCTGCGLCAFVCPIQAIAMEDRHPVWEKERCVQCLSCLHRCPVKAINYGRSRNNGRYLNPNVSQF